MLVYRLCNPRYVRDLSGSGAAIVGGRWNKKGRAVLYTSESVAVALLEIVVNIPLMLKPNLHLLTLEIPEKLILEIPRGELPYNWNKYPSPYVLAEIAEKYYKNPDILGIKVPSAVIASNFNYILNPNSAAYSNLKIQQTEPFIFDPRLYRGQGGKLKE